jgi:DNA recombination protein RmuC
MTVIVLVVGLFVGGGAVWLMMRRRAHALAEQEERVRGERDEARLAVAERERQLAEVRGDLQAQVVGLEAQLNAERDGSEEKVRLLEATKASLDETIKASCVDAFKEGNAQVVALAQERFRAERAENKREIAAMIKPVTDGLSAFKSRLDEIERAHIEGRAELQEQLTSLGQAQKELLSGTDALVGALQRPHIRGRWGEMTLKRVVETAGMLPHVDFSTQPTLDGEDGPRRPDLIVHIPGEKDVVVDSKVPLDAYLDACSATDEEERRRHLHSSCANTSRSSARRPIGRSRRRCPTSSSSSSRMTRSSRPPPRWIRT